MPTVAQLNVDVEADISGAVAGFAEVNALINAMNARHVQDLMVKLDIDADGVGQALADLAAVQAAAAAVDGKDVNIQVHDRGVHGVVGSLGALSFAATRASGSVRLLAAAILTLAPAAIPVLGALTIGVMNLAGAFTAAGIGATLFGVTVLSVYKPVTDGVNKIRAAELELTRAITDEQRETALENLRQAWMQLTPAQAEAAQTLIDFRDAWTDFTMQFQPAIFKVVETALLGLQGLFPRFGAILTPVIAMFQSLTERMFAALDTERGRAFFDWLATSAAPSLEALAVGLGNIVAGFAGMLMAFYPLQQDFEGGFVSMTEKFREWGMGLAQNEGFQEFVAYMRANIPKVLDFLHSLWEAFTGLLTSLAPAGQWAIGFLKSLLDGFKNLVTANPILTSLAALLLAVGIVMLKMAAPMLNIANMLFLTVGAFRAAGDGARFFMGALGVGALLVLGGALLWAYTHVDSFKEAVDSTFRAVIAIFKEMQPAIMMIVAAVGMLIPPFLNLVVALLPLIPAALQVVNVLLPFVAVAALLASVLIGKLVAALMPTIEAIVGFLVAVSENEAVVAMLATAILLYLLPAMYRLVAGWIMATGAAIAGAAANTWAWITLRAEVIASTAVAIWGFGVQVAGWIKMAAIATWGALTNVAAWLLLTVAESGSVGMAMVAFLFRMKQWPILAATAIANAVKSAGAWLILTIAESGSMGPAIAAFMLQVKGWITTAAVATANAVKIAIAWLIALGPVGLVILGIAAVAAAVYLIYDNWEAIVNWFKDLWAKVVGVFQTAVNWVQEIVTLGAADTHDAFAEEISAGTPKVEGAAREMGGGVLNGLSGLPGDMSGLGLDSSMGFASGMASGFPAIEGVSGMLGQAVTVPASKVEWDQLLLDEGQMTMEGLKDGVLAGQTTLAEECITIPDKMAQWTAIGFTAAEAQLALTAEHHFGTGITSGISKALPNIKTYIEGAMPGLADNLNLSAFQGPGRSVVDNLVLGYDAAFPRMEQLLKEMPAYLATTIPEDPWSEEGRLWMEEVARGIREGRFGLSNEVINLPWEVAGAIPAANELFSAKGKEWMDAVGNGIVDGQIQINALMQSLPEGASLILSNGVDLFSAAGLKWADAVGTGVMDGQIDLEAMLAGLPPEAVAALAEATEIAGFPGIGEDWLAGLETGMETGMPDLTTAAQGIPPEVLKGLGEDPGGLLQQPGADMVSGLGAGITGEVATVNTAMEEIKTAISTGWDAIALDAPIKIAVWKENVALGFAELRGTVISGMTSLRDQFTTGMNMMGAEVTAGFARMNGYVSGGFVALTATTTTGMGSMRAAVVTGFVQIGTGVTNSMTYIVAEVTTGFTAMINLVTAAMAITLAVMIASWSAAISVTVAFLAAMYSAIYNGTGQMYSRFVAALAAIVGQIRAHGAAAAAAASALASQVVNGVAWLPGRMYEAGQAAGWAFARGLYSMGDEVRGAAEYLAGQAAGAMPGSPAEWGPLSGAGYPYLRGQRMAQDLAAGMRSGVGAVSGASRALAMAASGPMTAGMGVPGAGRRGSTGISIGQINFEVSVGAGMDAKAARKAFDGAAEDITTRLAEAIRRRQGG